jgi:hypothetical protein
LFWVSLTGNRIKDQAGFSLGHSNLLGLKYYSSISPALAIRDKSDGGNYLLDDSLLKPRIESNLAILAKLTAAL